MHILIAPNAFKNSLTANAAALAIEKGLQQSSLNCTTECFPIADGGDGTATIIIQQLQGKLVSMQVHNPLGRIITASFGLIADGKTAVIEMADASGLRLLKSDELNPLRATSYGTGEMIKKALELGVNKILIAMGGSATVDGATGILSALGIKFLGDDGKELNNLPKSLTGLKSIDHSGIDQRISNCEVIVLCDVDNMLLGDNGSAAVFGPQKGADTDAVKKLNAALSKFNDITLQQLGKNMATVKYGGTAGGAAAGLYAHINAKLVNGIDYLLQLTNFDQSLQKSDLVITGEGSIDEQTLQGKGPFGVARRAKAKGIPVIGLAGKIPAADNPKLNEYFNALIAIGNEPSDIETALARTEENLIRTAKNTGEMLAIGKSAV
ncbi:glycerate kinase [Mucilaginibacter aquariorum]|uniref:Glycerate kinase n=1 Tax=Mucilaginibacter aquariorum TaxID=2967225 RepID=A0ABT1T027_9SPHI|nr:glycerate kinase [Mucilaginibacter aquariorum]MCQ6957815.1 glycerate kinase [Mucilaginibacter aquariorum]